MRNLMKIDFADEYKGYAYACLINPSGYRCGYVKLPKGHPWHGKGYFELNNYVSVHGGLTFAEKLKGDILGDGFWIGFDCAHLIMDKPDYKYVNQEILETIKLFEKTLNSFDERTVKTSNFVRKECKKLIDSCIDVSQLNELLEK